jgi:Tfp pilus assembly protein PilW
MTILEGAPRSRGWPKDSGFTVVEAVVASAVMLIVLLAVYMVYDTAQQDHSRGLARAAVQQDVRATFEKMSRELRGAAYIPSKTGCTSPPAGGITTISSSPVSVTFLADVDGDFCTDQVIYTFVPPTKSSVTNPCDISDPATIGKITRSVQAWNGSGWNPASPVAINQGQCITALALTYFDISGAQTTTPANVIQMSLSLSGVENSRMTGGKTYTLTTDLRLRNL